MSLFLYSRKFLSSITLPSLSTMRQWVMLRCSLLMLIIHQTHDEESYSSRRTTTIKLTD